MLGLRIIMCLFLVFIVPSMELVRFGSVQLGFFRFQVFETKLKIFSKILIGFFSGSTLLVIFFLVFSV